MATHRADASRMLDDRGYTGKLVRGQPPHMLLEEGVRNRIVRNLYFNEQLFATNEATILDRAVELRYVAGTYADRASPFICIILKWLQLLPSREIIDAYMNEGGEDFKYLRAVAAFYVRLTAETSEEAYKRLEPLLEDKRKLRLRTNDGFYRLTYMDEFVDNLLTKTRMCSTTLWPLVPRSQLEEQDKLEERISPCQHLLEEEEEEGRSERSERSSDRSRSASEISRSRSRSYSRSDSRESGSDRGMPNGHTSNRSESG